jgi:hypothetical protein
VLDVAEALAQDQRRDAGRRQWHAEVAAHPAEQLHRRRDPGELGAEGAGVGDHQGRQHQRRGPRPVALADEREQPLAGDDPQPYPELVEDDQRRGREGEDPEQLVAVLGAEDRVGGDPGRIVVGEAGQQARPDHCQQRRQPAAAQQQVTATRQPPVRVTARYSVSTVAGHGAASLRRPRRASAAVT